MRVCTCLGTCNGPERLASGWTCALTIDNTLSRYPADPMTPDAANGYIHEYEEWENDMKAMVDVRDKLMRRVAKLEAALRDIAAPQDCGCCPCTGACLSQEALGIVLDEFRDIATEALKP